MNSFGNNYYTQSQAPELTEFTADKNWQTASESKPYKEPELKTTPKETIIQNIKNTPKRFATITTLHCAL